MMTTTQTITAKFLWLWEKIKKYWLLFLFSIAAAFTLAFAKNKEQLIEDMMRERDAMLASHNARIEDIQAGIEAERKRREEIEKSYSELVKSIEDAKNVRAQEILAANKEQIKQLIERNRHDPEAMAVAVNRLFGITIVDTPVATENTSELPANPY